MSAEQNVPSLPVLERGRVCIARLADSTGVGLPVGLDADFELQVDGGTWQCLDLAVGTEVTAREGRHTITSDAPSWVQLSHGAGLRWGVLTPVDGAKAEKWKLKGRIRESATEPRAR